MWNKISDVILISALATLVVFAFLGLFQWISRKSLKKVDKELLMFPIPLIIMTITYFIFDKILIFNTRPNGSGEPSFPSTHVMVVATIFLMVAVILPKYIKNKIARIAIYILMLVLIALVSAGRILANMHWPLDVVGGIVFAIIFTEIYYLLIKSRKKEKNK